VAAEAVFQQARTLLEQGKVAEACPKFAESYRLDPATGTLLGLALCHEQEQKLASAWTEFSEASGRASNEGQQDRAEYAAQRVRELAPRLSTLSIVVPPEVAKTPGLRITRNGTVVGSAIFDTPVPIDGGEAIVEVSAPDKQTWQQKVDVEKEQARVVVNVPALVDVPAAAANDAGTGSAATPTDAPPGDEPLFTPLQWTGIGIAGAGVVALGVGGYFLSDALDMKAQSDSDCDSGGCGPTGLDLRTQAVDSGDLATVFGITGVVLAGGGATLFFLAPKPGAQAGPRVRNIALLGDGQRWFASARGEF
jgi:hypothetical protein